MSLEKLWDYEFEVDDRFQFDLTNTLEMKEPEQELLLPQLTEEGREAMYVKEKEPILVVLGNPQYSVSSENNSEFIEKLMADYKRKVKKERNIQPLKEKKVRYVDVWGLRDVKYKYLRKNDVTSTDWLVLEPREPQYFFVPKDFELQEEYDKFWKVTDIFKVYSSGVKTNRDYFVVGFTKEEITQRLKVFTGNLSDEFVKKSMNIKNTSDWCLNSVRAKVKQIKLKKFIRRYSYRPFDIRFACYNQYLIDRDRWDLMQFFFADNLALTTIRSEAKDVDFSHSSISSFVTDILYVGGQSYIFPPPLHLS